MSGVYRIPEVIIQHTSSLFVSAPAGHHLSEENTHNSVQLKTTVVLSCILGHLMHSTTTPADQDHLHLPSIPRKMNCHFPLPDLALQVRSTLVSNAGTYPKPNTGRKTDLSSLPGHSVYLHGPDGKCL